MKKTYKNKQTGLTLVVEGPVLICSDGAKLDLGSDKLALEMAEFMADELGMELEPLDGSAHDPVGSKEVKA